MPHQTPAENNAATATRPIATLNPGRELPGRERRCRNDKTRGSCVGGVDSSFSDRTSDGISNGTAKGSSATLRLDISTKAVGMTTGWARISRSGSSVAEEIAVAGDG